MKLDKKEFELHKMSYQTKLSTRVDMLKRLFEKSAKKVQNEVMVPEKHIFG